MLKKSSQSVDTSIVSDCSESASSDQSEGSMIEASTNCVAMDCEMVGVGPQRFSVLARVTVTDCYGDLVLDSFVRVEEKVTDYRTHVSGIRPADLKSNKAISFGECRSKVVAAIEGKILVGHALENDLKILNIHHPMDRIRDTAVYAPFMRVGHDGTWQPRRLAELSRTFLGVNIQQYEHCSMEDARAAMQLYRAVQQDWDYAVEMEVERRRAIMFQQSMFHYSNRHPSSYDWVYTNSSY